MNNLNAFKGHYFTLKFICDVLNKTKIIEFNKLSSQKLNKSWI